MPRSQYSDVVFDNTGNPINGATVTVKTVDANGIQGGNATIYASETGATISNPFLTTADGYFEFWADVNARYDVILTAAGMTTRTRRWDSAWWGPRADAINLSHIDESIAQLGDVKYWHRLYPGQPLPSTYPGYVIAMGQTLGPAEHNVPGVTNLVVPNLVDRSPVGADYNKVDGTAPGGDGVAPGIGGIGGASFRTYPHTHTVDAHQHTVDAHAHYVFGHVHGMKNHWHGVAAHHHTVKTKYGQINTQSQNQFIGLIDTTTTDDGSYTGGPSDNTTDTGDSSTDNRSPNTDFRSPGTNSGTSATNLLDLRQKVIGLLPLIKVRTQ